MEKGDWRAVGLSIMMGAIFVIGLYFVGVLH